MNNFRKNNVAIVRSSKARARSKSMMLLISLLFFSSLVGLASFSVNANETTRNTKGNSGYYDGIFGKGVYWVTPRLYSTIFNVDDNILSNSNGVAIKKEKLQDSVCKSKNKQKRYFIYSSFDSDQARNFVQIIRNAAQADKGRVRHKLRLARKTQIKISMIMQSRNFIQV